MTKPVDEEEMLLRIKALLRRAKIVSEKKITIGEMTLDYDSFTVTKNGQTQELPRRNSCCCISCFLIRGRFLPESS